jgi:hypothetical protein
MSGIPANSCPFCLSRKISETGRVRRLINYACDACAKHWSEAEPVHHKARRDSQDTAGYFDTFPSRTDGAA